MIQTCPNCGSLLREPKRKRIVHALPGPSRKAKRDEAEAVESAAKGDAFTRAGRVFGADGSVFRHARCEYRSGAICCYSTGTDADHIIGGASKRDMERLGAEGFQVFCRAHHDLKTANSPTRVFWLDVAEEHALRVGARKLLPFIARARAKLEGKRLRQRAGGVRE